MDPLGLVNRGVGAHVKQKDMTWALRTYRPEYIIANQRFRKMLYDKLYSEPWFGQEYERIEDLEHPGADTLYVHKRRDYKPAVKG